jgi:CheY-like chemotaxis protein
VTPEARLLIVEDDDEIRDLLAAALRFAGFDVTTAATGGEAVQAAQRGRPDLVVLDERQSSIEWEGRSATTGCGAPLRRYSTSKRPE